MKAEKYFMDYNAFLRRIQRQIKDKEWPFAVKMHSKYKEIRDSSKSAEVKAHCEKQMEYYESKFPQLKVK